jgi:predicted RecB family nuclease
VSDRHVSSRLFVLVFRLSDDRLVLSASDITSYLACSHLIEQRRAVALGERTKWPVVPDPHADLARDHGNEHELAVLERLSAELGGHVDLTPATTSFSTEALAAEAIRTADVMRAGVPLIFQALLFDGRWQGRVDFLRRVESRSALGDFSYEVLDTKLAREPKPYVVHQLALYTRLVGEVQGVQPAAAFLILGDGTERMVELGRYGALHRHVARRLERLVEAGQTVTYPEPTAHCGFCALDFECSQRRRTDDHLSLVANARRDQRDRLVDLGITTVLDLATAPDGLPVGKLGEERFDLLRHQAALQVKTRRDGGRHHRHLKPLFDRGYARLPQPDAGDVFFDLEGDPYVGSDGGIEYLWGWSTPEGLYHHLWAHDLDEEKAALEAFVDFVVGRRKSSPSMHVFHYAAHEASKLRSLALKYATREDEVDDLLRNGVLVDLYAVVRQGLQVGEESYGLKKLERHTAFVRRETTVRDGGGSIVAYERWLETGRADILEAIRAYNEEDCVSTRVLRDWLLDPMRVEASRQFEVDFTALEPPEEEKTYAPSELDVRLAALAGRLAAGLSADEAGDDVDEAERRLLSHLMLFHKREAKPEWWRHFALRKMTSEQLIDERDAVGGLMTDPAAPPSPAPRDATDWSFTFPPQEFKLDSDQAIDPETGKSLNVQLLTDDQVVIRRKTAQGPPTARALIGGGAIRADALRQALEELGTATLESQAIGAAARTILRRERPRLRSGRAFTQTGDASLEAMIETALNLDRSHLIVQGPPGTGKTYRGARMIVAALSAGRRVAVTAPSHEAIKNLLRAVEVAAHETGVRFRGVYKGGGYRSRHHLIESVGSNNATVGDFDLVAGTAWLVGRPEHRSGVDLLFIDEAGQYSLANAIAVSLCASSVVLLGDPQQLPQVTQASHPGSSGCSVLEHLLAGASTIPSDRGYFLTESWRMHPDVCAFVSERSYDDRLRSREACALRRIDASVAGTLAGARLRALAVKHEGRSQSSPEEAAAIVDACRALLSGGRTTNDTGKTADLSQTDLMVVAPYNLAVRCIADHLEAAGLGRIPVGTVDKFQGQEAAVVFFAMTCSSGEDVPRGLDFLFDRNRLNVAVSRAQSLAVLVYSPRLLDADCRTLETMELVDGACRFVELAESQSPSVEAATAAP